MSELSFAERVAWLRLARSDGVGPVTFRRLIARFGSPAAAIERAPSLIGDRRGARAFRAAPREAAEAELDAADRVGERAIALCETDYPHALAAIPDPPPILFVIGRPDLFAPPAAAIVGARNASLAGRKMAETLAEGLGGAGVVVVSGLARGIDGAAHRASLATGAIAAVAGGVDVIYPPEHAELTRDLAERGAIVSERPPGVQPMARDFPRRNRIISGLARVVIVVEAASKSGTLITARLALEQGRDVFAVPGSPLDPRAAGANRLLQQGAGLATCAEDVLESIASARLRPSSFRFEEDQDDLPGDAFDGGSDDMGDYDGRRLAAVADEVRELLGAAPVHRDALVRAVDAPAGAVLDAIVELILGGEAAEADGGAFVRLYK